MTPYLMKKNHDPPTGCEKKIRTPNKIKVKVKVGRFWKLDARHIDGELSHFLL